ncbi:hypothetical protein BWQ92_15305 [Arthrobacter sp. QXT-31]|nr:oligosaccharide flippase family protein [Arthrobacter sp. QXT-31]APX02894.1 hypothetical protein BWQ92_15305 [Arthrobacter sp. QXT-31]
MTVVRRYSTYFWTFGSRVGVIGLTAIFGILSARLLGPTDKGIYTVATLIPAIISTIAMLAGPQVVVMDVSKNGAVGPRIHKLLRWSLMTASIGASICFLVQLASTSGELSPINLLAGIASFIGPALIIPEFFAALLQARRAFRALALFRIFQIFLPGFLMIVGLTFFQLGGALLGYVTGTTIVAAYTCALWAKSSKIRKSALGGRDAVPWNFVLTTNITLIVLFMSYRLDVIILNAISTSKEVGLYSAAVALAELVLVASMTAAVVRAPAYAVDHSRSIGTDTWIVLGLSALASVTIAAISPTLVPLLFGTDYKESVFAVWGLLPGICVLSVYRYISNAEIIRGHKFGVLYSCLIAIGVDIAVLIFIGADMGALGASLAASLGYASGLVYLLGHRSIRARASTPRSARKGKLLMSRD